MINEDFRACLERKTQRFAKLIEIELGKAFDEMPKLSAKQQAQIDTIYAERCAADPDYDPWAGDGWCGMSDW